MQLFLQKGVNLLTIIFGMFHQKSLSTSYLHRFKMDPKVNKHIYWNKPF